MNAVSTTRLVLIPSYNPGSRLRQTVEECLRHWAPIWVVVDGSTDGSEASVLALAACDPRVRVLRRARNGGKGAAIRTGVEAALAAGFTHALTMDADGQHPADLIPAFMHASAEAPTAMILGRPVFGPEAPAARRQGRKLSIAIARCEILGKGIDDPLFGFRVYPLSALDRAFRATRWARGFDFDHEVTVRMFWDGTPPINLPAPCRYLSRADGGVSHFRYVRDNALLVWLQLRLLGELILWRWPAVVRLRRIRRLAVVAAVLLLLAVPAIAKAGSVSPALEPVIADRDPAWLARFQALAAGGDRSAHFVEQRYFDFREKPVISSGEVRISATRGFSLAYETPERRTLIVDGQGILLRNQRGRDETPPGGSHLRESIDALVGIFRFDLAALEKTYVLRGEQRGDAWRLVCVARASAPGGFAILRLSGKGDFPQSIALERSATDRIVIELSDERRGVSFSAPEQRAFFRR